MSDDTFTGADFEAAATGGDTSVSASPESATATIDSSTPPEAATTAPVDASIPSSPSIDPAQAGPIPFNVHKTALDNARSKAVAEWEQQYGWAKQVDPQEFQRVVEMSRKASADPIAYLQDFIKEIQQDPKYGAQLRSLAARALSQRQQQVVDEQEPQPDVPIQLDNGRVLNLYSAEQQAKREAFLQRQWMSQVKQEFSPVTKTIETLQAREAEAVRQSEIHSYVSTTHQDVTTWPGMQDEANRVAVASELASMRLSSDDPREVTLALNAAYRKAVLPNLHRSAMQSVLSTTRQHASAGTVNPGQTSTRAAKSMDEMSIAEALQHVAAQGR